MPTTYAHYKLGEEVRRAVSQPISQVIEEYPELFQIGLHGPDLLFYYKALSKNKVNSLGFELHEYSGRYFFERAARVLKSTHMDKAHLSYIYGFLCHFSLDITCHGYVNKTVIESGISHMEIEAEMDRELLVRDHKDPIREILTRHLVYRDFNASVIADFFPELTKQEVGKSIKDMVFYLNFLVAPGKLKRKLIYQGMQMAGKYEELKGLVINLEKNPACEESTQKLLVLFEEGKEVAVNLLEEYYSYLVEDKELGEKFALNFESVLPSEGKE